VLIAIKNSPITGGTKDGKTRIARGVRGSGGGDPDYYPFPPSFVAMY